MKKVFKYALVLLAASVMPLSFSSCSNDDNNGNDSTDPKYSDKSYGTAAMDACNTLSLALRDANKAIASAQLTDDQKKELQDILSNNVDAVMYPTYKDLATAVEKLQKALGDLSVSQITQQNVDDACTAFKEARALWENSEAFLGGAATEFGIDPHIDSWPLNRTSLHSWFVSGMQGTPADESVLGFHAIEFVLFRNGQPRKVAEFSQNDTYKEFTDVKGSDELKYAQLVAKDLLNHAYELEVSWTDTPDAAHLEAVKAAKLEYLTKKGKSFAYNMKNVGNASVSTFSTLNAAIEFVLAAEEGGCWQISNEVGTAKIANPFQSGDISYVESPYSYNSITDFQNNIRSVENIWYGNRDGKNSPAELSFHNFFKKNNSAVGAKVEAAIQDAIDKIGAMPFPFVKYVSTVWGKQFDETPVPEGGDE